MHEDARRCHKLRQVAGAKSLATFCDSGSVSSGSGFIWPRCHSPACCAAEFQEFRTATWPKVIKSRSLHTEFGAATCCDHLTAAVKNFNMFQPGLYFRTCGDTNIKRARKKRFIKTNPETRLDLTVKPALAVAQSNSKCEPFSTSWYLMSLQLYMFVSGNRYFLGVSKFQKRLRIGEHSCRVDPCWHMLTHAAVCWIVIWVTDKLAED